MSDGRIYITISDERTGEIISGTTKLAPTKKKEESKENGFSRYIQHQFFNLIEQEAVSMVNYTLGNIGNFTGDYNAQREVNFARSAFGVIRNIGTAAAQGATIGGGYGALIGAAIATTAETVKFGFQLHSQNIETKKQNYSINQLKQLSGLDGLTNGSRI